MRLVRIVIVGGALFDVACSATPTAGVATIDAPMRAPSPPRLPAGDRDHDGVVNASDVCPISAEDADGIADGDGCPEDDADQDGVLDVRDACPNQPGGTRVEPDKNGCPYVDRFPRVPDETITITPRVHFTYGDASTIDAKELAGLDELATVINEHPEIRKIEVQGDASTDEPDPTKLGERRAQKVLDALVARGVAAERLVAKSYGTTRPLADSATTDGRAQNRRVGFIVLEWSP